MQVIVSQEQTRVPVAVLLVKGNVDSSTYELLETSAQQAIAAGAKDLLIDLTDVSYMSIDEFLDIHKNRQDALAAF